MEIIESRSAITNNTAWNGNQRTLYKGEGELPPENKGLLGHTRQYLLGQKAAKWLEDTGDEAFDSARKTLQQVKRVQAVLDELLDDYGNGILPQVTRMTAEGVVTEDMSPISFAQKIADLAVAVNSAADKAISIRNKVATGGLNLMAGSMLAVGMAQAAAGERRVMRPARKVGVDAIPEGVIDV